MTGAEITVTSLGELVDHVTPTAPDPATGRWRTSRVYHGSADAAWPLLTSLDRLGGVTPPHTKAHLESHVLRHFLRYARPYLSGSHPNDWELLVAAQHHGVPTRLLDWSYSPLVAGALCDKYAGGTDCGCNLAAQLAADSPSLRPSSVGAANH